MASIYMYMYTYINRHIYIKRTPKNNLKRSQSHGYIRSKRNAILSSLLQAVHLVLIRKLFELQCQMIYTLLMSVLGQYEKG